MLFHKNMNTQSNRGSRSDMPQAPPSCSSGHTLSTPAPVPDADSITLPPITAHPSPPTPAPPAPIVLSVQKQTAPASPAKAKPMAQRRIRSIHTPTPNPDYAIPTDKLENFLLPCFLTINITLITIGSKYYNECPGEPTIPLYVVVSGIAGVSFDVSRIVDRITMFLFEYSYSVSPVIALFIFVWFGYGNVLVVVTKSRTNLIIPDHSYCNPRIYWLTVWYIMFLWMVIIVALVYYINVWYC